MSGTVRIRFWLVFALALTVILGSQATPSPNLAGAHGTPVSGATLPGSLPDMLGHLPNLPLAQSEATIAYAILAQQAAATGVNPTSATALDAEQRAWVSAMMNLFLPSTAPHWLQDEWVEAIGFDMYQVEQAIEYAAPPPRVTVLRGSFAADGMREAWGRAGYQPIDLDHGEAFAIRDDFAQDLNDPICRRVLAAMNVIALADDGALIAGSDRATVAGALAAASGAGPSLGERPDVEPLAATAPDDLATALLLPGTFVQLAPDVASIAMEGETVDAMTTRMAEEQAAERGATIVTERLETDGPPSGLSGVDAERSWAEMFPQRTVDAVADAGVVLVTLTPAANTRLNALSFLVFSRALTFMAW